MGYKTIQETGRYIVIDEGTFGLEKKSTSNLNENELKVVFLETEDCPINEDCVHLIGMLPDEISSICKYLGAYPTVSIEGKLVYNRLPCLHEDRQVDLEVKILKSEKCPVDKLGCLGCEYIENVIIPIQGNLDKSHAHLVCGKLKAEKG